MNKFGLLLGLVLTSASTGALGQVSNSIKLNEVMTNNTTSLQDEYGRREA